MKIGFVLDDGLDTNDGVQQYVVGLADWLSAKGHQVHYLVGETKSSGRANLHPMSKNLRVRFNGNVLGTPLPASKKNIKALLSKEQFDILHVQVPYSPFMAARVMNLSLPNTRIIGTFHILPFGKIQQLGVRAWGLLLRRNSRKFDRMLAVSGPAAALCESSLGIKADVVGNHVDTRKFSSVVNSNKSSKNVAKIVFLGRLVERKGAMHLIKAVKYMIDHNLVDKELQVAVGGKGPQMRELADFIDTSGLSDTVKLLGMIDEDKKAEFLSQADLAVFPSIGGESFGIVLIEAMAANAGVVLAGDNPGYASVLSESKEAIFNPKDTKAFAETMANYINDPELSSQVHKKQQSIVKQFDINVIGEQVLSEYTALAKTDSSSQTKS